MQWSAFDILRAERQREQRRPIETAIDDDAPRPEDPETPRPRTARTESLKVRDTRPTLAALWLGDWEGNEGGRD